MTARRCKDALLAIPWLGRRLQALYGRYRAWRYNPARHLWRLFKSQPSVFVVQIGSNDGRTDDPVHQLLTLHPGGGALLVEPVPHLFAQLRATYASKPSFRFANVVIAESPGFQPFYFLRPDTASRLGRLPHYWSQLGSLDRAHILSQLGDRVAPYIQESSLQAVTLPQLLMEHQVRRVDVLHIDAEGADWMILQQLDLEAFPARVILFEVKNLSPEDRAAAVRFLSGHYQIHDFGQDFFCRRKAPGPLL
jgi:FkbM family methyltransferase